MAILRVAQLGHPVLRIPCDPVTPEVLASSVFQLFCEDLLETMDDYDGAGLAAPQVHISLRVVALTLSDDVGPEFLINPVITVLADTTRRTWEGCLSVAGMRALVERPDHIRIDAISRTGDPISYELQGFPAVVAQHECDHLDGVIYVDKALPRSLTFVPEYRRYGPPDEYVSEDDFDDDEEDWVDDGYREELTDERELLLNEPTDHDA